MESKITFDDWHRIVESRDLEALRAVLADDVTFRSPAVFKPYTGSNAAFRILAAVFGLFEEFAYHRTWTSTGAWVLEFTAVIGERRTQVHGVDIIEWDDGGRKIVRFEVMIRPLSALEALKNEMGKRLAAQPSSSKL